MKYSLRNPLLLTLLLATTTLAAPASYQYPFQDPNLQTEKRIDNLLSLMNRDEKLTALGTNPSVPRLGIKASGQVEGLHGLAQGGPGRWGRPRVIPTTTFPQAIGMAETWDPDLIQKAAAIEGYEARYIFQSPRYHQGGLVIRAPNADLGRDPRWGRTEECFGEDPCLTGAFTLAVVKGLQGDDPKYWQAASLLKHFLANSNEDNRGRSTSNFDQRLLREYYTVGFERGIVEGGARAFMAAYNAHNGIPCTVDPILRNIAINEWGQNGIICTDAGGLRFMVSEHHHFETLDEAAAAAIHAGINQFLDRYRPPVEEALKKGLLTEADIDQALRGSYRVMIHLGLLDPPDQVPYSKIGQDPQEPWLTDANKSLARQVTRESIVLLKNQNNLLPLDRQKIKSIAVIGPRAGEVLIDWYSGTPPYAVTPIEGIRNHTDRNITINYAPSDDDGGVLYSAQNSDVAIVLVGNHPTGAAGGWEKVTLPSYGREAVDRQSITLEQEDLIKKVAAVNPKTIVVLISSFPYAINWTNQNVPAILHMTHNSQELGNALADVLFGDYTPAGRLVQTWPISLDQLPPMMDYNIRNGRTYMYPAKTPPLYPFGFGLSYTTFQYSNLKTSAESISTNGSITVTADIKNTGPRPGDEVVQLYIHHQNSKIDRPAKELKAFERISIKPNETKTISIELPATSLAYWNTENQKFEIEPDQTELQLGSSSTDIRLRKTIPISLPTTQPIGAH
jgi:beta-glucosidase